MNNSNESNVVTVDKIIVLLEEISVLRSRFKDEDTDNLRKTVNVLEDRVQELRSRVHN